MKTKQFKVETYIERVYCDECEEELKSTGTVFLVYPELYEYICPNCKKIYTSHYSYPRKIYKEIKEEKKDE